MPRDWVASPREPLMRILLVVVAALFAIVAVPVFLAEHFGRPWPPYPAAHVVLAILAGGFVCAFPAVFAYRCGTQCLGGSRTGRRAGPRANGTNRRKTPRARGRPAAVGAPLAGVVPAAAAGEGARAKEAAQRARASPGRTARISCAASATIGGRAPATSASVGCAALCLGVLRRRSRPTVLVMIPMLWATRRAYWQTMVVIIRCSFLAVCWKCVPQLPLEQDCSSN